jgi:hypothetical protein
MLHLQYSWHWSCLCGSQGLKAAVSDHLCIQASIARIVDLYTSKLASEMALDAYVNG